MGPISRALPAAVLALTVCATAPAMAKVHLLYTFWGGTEEADIQRQLVAAFNERHPGIEVEALHIPSGYEAKVQTMIAGGAGPDIMFFQDEPFPAWVRTGVFEDLSPYFAKDPSIDFNDFLPQTREYFQYNGRQWSLPAEGGPITWYYNRTFFAEAGLPFPTRNWTVAEFLDDVRKLTRDFDGDGRMDVFGVTMPDGWIYNEPWVWTFGARYLDIDMEKREIAQVLTNTPEFVEAMKFLQDVRFAYGVHGGSFTEGTSAMYITGPWGISGTAPRMAAAGYDWDFAHMPIGPRGDRATRQSFDTWVIWSGSPHKEEAYQFVSFAHSPEGQRLFSTRAMPARFSALRSLIRPDTPFHEEVFVEIMQEYGWMQPTHLLYNEVGRVFDTYVNRVLRNEIPPREAAERMYREGNAILASVWPENWQAAWEETGTIPADEADRIFAAYRALRGGR
ncbi:MAG TPA: extracellular solute-binding protein [Limnochordia bacterium]